MMMMMKMVPRVAKNQALLLVAGALLLLLGFAACAQAATVQVDLVPCILSPSSESEIVSGLVGFCCCCSFFVQSELVCVCRCFCLCRCVIHVCMYERPSYHTSSDNSCSSKMQCFVWWNLEFANSTI